MKKHKPIEIEELPLDQQTEESLERQVDIARGRRDLAIIDQLAMIDVGWSYFKSDARLARTLGLSLERIQAIRKLKSEEILKIKESFNRGRLALSERITRKLDYVTLYEEAIGRGDAKTAQAVLKITKTIDTILPMNEILEAAQALKMLSDDVAESRNQTSVTVNVNPSVLKAEQDMERVNNLTIDLKEDTPDE